MAEVLELWSLAKGSADGEYFFGAKRNRRCPAAVSLFSRRLGWRA
jgi:hypothetical protein